MLHFHIILTMIILAIMLIAANTPNAEGKSIPGDPIAVEEVISGKRKKAKVSWWGFDPKDATTAMQSAINSGADKLIIENMGSPWVVDKIQLASDQELFFEKGVVVIAKKGAFRGKGDSLFTASLKSNITLSGYGATLKMHKSDYVGEGYEKAEWRHALSIRSCSNIRVYGLTLAESGGDGIYLGVAQKGITNTDIHIKDVICDSNHRQGISVISARNLLIENCVLRNTSGTPPAAGIDFEPNHASEELVNCIMRNCVSENNDGDGYEFYIRNLNGKSADLSIRLENCRSVGDRTSLRYVINNGPGDAAVKGLAEFVNCSFENGRNGGVIIGDKPADAGRIRFEKCVISNPALDNAEVSPIVFNTRHGATEDVGGVDFEDCVIHDPVDRIPLDFKDWSGDLRLADVTGSLVVDRDGVKIEHQITPELLKDWVPMLSLKRIPRLSLSGVKLRPVFPDADPDKFSKCFARLRKDAKCILYAKENEKVQLSIHHFQVGRYSGNPMPVKIYSSAGELIHEQNIDFQSEAEIQFVVPKTGIYSMAFSTGANAAQITRTSHRLCISSQDAPIHFIGMTGQLYFYVPKGSEEFGVKAFGENVSEAVKITLLDASGNGIETKDNITQPYVLITNREDTNSGEIWAIKIEKPSATSFEDYYIQLLGVPPLVSCSKEALLMPVE
jgi:hypothetical protein